MTEPVVMHGPSGCRKPEKWDGVALVYQATEELEQNMVSFGSSSRPLEVHLVLSRPMARSGRIVSGLFAKLDIEGESHPGSFTSESRDLLSAAASWNCPKDLAWFSRVPDGADSVGGNSISTTPPLAVSMK